MGAKKLHKLKVKRKEAELTILQNPYAVARQQCQKSFYFFFMYFWEEIASTELANNWHIKYLCDELQKVAEHRATKQPKMYDLIINIPPGTTKTSIVSIAFPAWCWVNWYWMRFITGSYSSPLSLESAEYSRDLIKSEKWKKTFPELTIKRDKENKSNFRVQKQVVINKNGVSRLLRGGNRFSTSVGGTLTGFHGDINIVDDPLNPEQAVSDTQLKKANRWCDRTLSNRKTNKKASITIYVMQRLHQNDPSGHLLAKKKRKIKHICLPAEIDNYREFVKPKELLLQYKDNLLDPIRIDREVLKEAEADMGQYEYAGQMGQNPTPPGGGMFKVDRFTILQALPAPNEFQSIVRYWDKAGTTNAGAFTAGVKMAKMKDGTFIVLDVVRGQWGAAEREKMIKQIARSDESQKLRFNNLRTKIWIEQEPGSGGKESAENTIKNLAGFLAYKERPMGDKVYRADPYSVQANNGNVLLYQGEWNNTFIEEHRHFPFSTYKDQVDAAGAAFSRLNSKKMAKSH